MVVVGSGHCKIFQWLQFFVLFFCFFVFCFLIFVFVFVTITGTITNLCFFSCFFFRLIKFLLLSALRLPVFPVCQARPVTEPEAHRVANPRTLPLSQPKNTLRLYSYLIINYLNLKLALVTKILCSLCSN